MTVTIDLSPAGIGDRVLARITEIDDELLAMSHSQAKAGFEVLRKRGKLMDERNLLKALVDPS